MIRKNPREVADRAVYLLNSIGVPANEIMRCCGISERGICQAIKRVEAERYGKLVPYTMKPGDGRRGVR